MKIAGASTPAAIDGAARLLESGALVAFPTETVYGLGADAENPDAVRRIYAAKGRPANHPLIVHLAYGADPGYWSRAVCVSAKKLIGAFWPGPLTLILPRAAHIPDTVAGGQDSIGLRCPAHPVAQALLGNFKGGNGGVAAPSANRFGHVSPTTAQHVRDEFCDATLLECVLDGGQSVVGIESTILDLSRGIPVLLRPGHIGAEQIANVLGRMPMQPDMAAPRVSGALPSHYAPRTPLALVTSKALSETLKTLQLAGWRIALMQHKESAGFETCGDDRHPDAFLASTLANSPGLAVLPPAEAARAVSGPSSGPASPTVLRASGRMTLRLTLPTHPAAYAHGLYAALRALDGTTADLIVVEAPPQSAGWQAVNDRLARAAHGSLGVLPQMLRAAHA